MKSILLLLVLVVSVHVRGQGEPLKNGFSAQQMQWMAEQNSLNNYQGTILPNYLGTPGLNDDSSRFNGVEVRPFAEYEKAGYLIFSSGFGFSSQQAKRIMAKNLPQGVHLVVYTQSSNMDRARSLKHQYSQLIGSDRVSIVYMPSGGDAFWARDGVPVPVIEEESSQLTVVDAKYYHHFEADDEFGDLFNADVSKHNYYFEGGNFMANSLNDCIVVNTAPTRKIPDSIFEKHYGCERLIRLPFVKGIGHIDESVKFVDSKTVLTDERSYVNTLKRAGFEVKILPRPSNPFETYVNSLIVNGVVYVPIFNQATDQKALQVYRDQGFQKVIGIDSVHLSNQGQGSLHCITMTYPAVEMKEALAHMGGHILL